MEPNAPGFAAASAGTGALTDASPGRLIGWGLAAAGALGAGAAGVSAGAGVGAPDGSVSDMWVFLVDLALGPQGGEQPGFVDASAERENALDAGMKTGQSPARPPGATVKSAPRRPMTLAWRRRACQRATGFAASRAWTNSRRSSRCRTRSTNASA